MRSSDWSSDVCSSDLITAPICQGMNSASPKPSASDFDGVPLATSRILSKISWPTCTTVFSPSAMPPQLMSMSSAMRLYMAVLVASLMDGEGLNPNTDPRPRVEQTMVAPGGTFPHTG